MRLMAARRSFSPINLLESMVVLFCFASIENTINGGRINVSAVPPLITFLEAERKNSAQEAEIRLESIPQVQSSNANAKNNVRQSSPANEGISIAFSPPRSRNRKHTVDHTAYRRQTSPMRTENNRQAGANRGEDDVQVESATDSDASDNFPLPQRPIGATDEGLQIETPKGGKRLKLAFN